MQLAALYRKLFGPKQTLVDPFAGVRFVSPLVRPAKHHHFRLRSRNQWTGVSSYQCRCGAWYTRDIHGWRMSEGVGLRNHTQCFPARRS